MSEENINKNEVDITLEEERKESEARSILQDLERLITVPHQRKRRWIWELLQNAKDCGLKNGAFEQKEITVSIILEKNKLIFSHNGIPFTLKNLLALVRRTSTKSYDNSEGNTGKFGTGFVTTHVLNRTVKVSGLLHAKEGLSEFEITIDRTTNDLDTLQKELNNVFSIINSIYTKPKSHFDDTRVTQYEYILDDDTNVLAIQSVEDFVKNLPFTLLINSPGEKPGIKTVNVNLYGEITSYSLANPERIHDELLFSEIKDNNQGIKSGLLHFIKNNLLIAVPAIKTIDNWEILRNSEASKLYKEFPLIGTEDWHIPFLVQSTDFSPSEPRDGIRTIKENVAKPDNTADKNRQALIDYRDTAKDFFSLMQKAGIGKLFLLTESGLPEEKIEYTAKDWFQEQIQRPMREFLMTQPLLKTVNGNLLQISNARIPHFFEDQSLNEEFFDLAKKYYYNLFPDDTTYKDWQRIIHQESEEWGANIICGPDDLVRELSSQGLDKLALKEGETYTNWLNKLIGFINKIGRKDLGEDNNIYPNQRGQLKKKQELRIDPGLIDEIKSVGDRLGLPVYDELLHIDITENDGIDLYNSKNYFLAINKALGDLVPSDQNAIAYSAVLDLVAMFPDNLSEGRNEWYVHIKQLLTYKIPEKLEVTDMDEIFKKSISSRFASFKYVCWLISEQQNFIAFCNTYFEGQQNAAYIWLNTFIGILYRREEYTELMRKYPVIPLQNGFFSKLESHIYREDKDQPFDLIFKQLYTDFGGKEDALSILIAKEITCSELPSNSAKLLTNPIDALFIKPDIEKNISPDAPLNPLFHQLNDWISKNESEGLELFPHFSKARPELYVKAFGPEVSHMVMAIHKLNKPIEEIEALVNLNVSSEELSVLIKASQIAGGSSRLLAVAQEIELAALDAKWRKEIGDAAENAFKSAMEGIKTFSIENPDKGYDFEILYGNQAPYFLEIKSTIESKETVKMTGVQGVTAKDFSDRYALCVVLRKEIDTKVDEAYFRTNAKFILKIGDLIKDKVAGMQNNLNIISTYNAGEIQARLDNSNYTVNVSRNAWAEYLNFDQFIQFLSNEYFRI